MTSVVDFQVHAMTCASCVARVERALAAVPGVRAARANLVTLTARAEFDPPASPPAMAEALKAASYPAVEETARLSVTGMTCASCVARVERALLAAPGVLSAQANFATGTASAQYLAGMVSPSELAAAVTKSGYAAVPAQAEPEAATLDRVAVETARLRRDTIVAAALTMPVVVLAMGPHVYAPFHHWIAASIGEWNSWAAQMLLSAAVLAFPGRRFFTIGFPALIRAAPEMNSLVALGASAAFLYSTVAVAAPGLLPPDARVVYFEAAAVIVTLILLGRLLEVRARGRAGEAIQRLVRLRPETATVLRAGVAVSIAVAELTPGDVVRLAPGERVATDGVLSEGAGHVDESMLTGEPAPVVKAVGDPVTGGTINGNSALAFRVTAIGEATVLSRILRLVEDAQSGKLPVQALVDRVTLWFVPAVMAVAALAFLGWLALGEGPALTRGLVAGISVLIIACPCAMGLATPMSILVGTGRGAELGILFRRGDALQRLASARIVAFDKTGTLTEGHPELVGIACAEGTDEATVLALAAAAEERSEHPLARAILNEARARGLTLPMVEAVTATPGKGLTARADGREIAIGNRAIMAAQGIDITSLSAKVDEYSAAAATPVFIAIDGRLAAVLAIADPLRAGAAEAIAELHSMGIETAMVSGDTRATAEAVARRLGIDRVAAEVLPEGKVAAIGTLGAGDGFAFVGDGINDAPALAAADVGIAMGSGTDVAIESAEVVLMRSDPRAVPTAIRLSRATLRNIRQNLFWAFGYNVALIPVAAGVLVPFGGPQLSPMLAAGAMALSSVFVVSNALRLRRAV